MATREEIREGIEQMQFLPNEFEVFEGTQTWSIRPRAVAKILNKLHSQGMVLKVDSHDLLAGKTYDTGYFVPLIERCGGIPTRPQPDMDKHRWEYLKPLDEGGD